MKDINNAVDACIYKENYEGAIPIAVTRYQLYIDGEEKILVDKLKGQVKVDGVDYAKDIKNLL
mgnify:CR=1 FL=1